MSIFSCYCVFLCVSTINCLTYSIVGLCLSEDLPVFALQDDRVVEVVGEPAATQKAIGLIASHLRKFLVDRSIISLIEMQVRYLLLVR